MALKALVRTFLAFGVTICFASRATAKCISCALDRNSDTSLDGLLKSGDVWGIVVAKAGAPRHRIVPRRSMSGFSDLLDHDLGGSAAPLPPKLLVTRIIGDERQPASASSSARFLPLSTTTIFGIFRLHVTGALRSSGRRFRAALPKRA